MQIPSWFEAELGKCRESDARTFSLAAGIWGRRPNLRGLLGLGRTSGAVPTEHNTRSTFAENIRELLI